MDITLAECAFNLRSCILKEFIQIAHDISHRHYYYSYDLKPKQKKRLNATMECIEIKQLLIFVGKFQGSYQSYSDFKIYNVLSILSSKHLDVILMSAE